LTLTAINTYTGATSIGNGTLALAGSGSIAASSGVNIGAGTFDISGGRNQTIRDLSGATGSTVVLGSNTLTVGTANSTTFAGIITGIGGLTKQGSGALTLSGANTYTGVTTINGGTLAPGPGGSVSGSGVNLAAAGAGLDISRGGNQSIMGLSGAAGSSVALGANTLTVNPGPNFPSTKFAGSISGSGGLVVNSLTPLTLSGANTYTGGTTIRSFLALGPGGSLAPTGSVNLVGIPSSFDISAAGNQTIGDLSGISSSAPIQVVLGANTLTVSSGSFGGNISGSGGLIKQGDGTLTLAGGNTYTGPTIVNGGTLALTGVGIAMSSGVNLTASGAVLSVPGPFQERINDLAGVPGTLVNVGNNTTLTFGASNSTTFAGQFSGPGTLAKQGSGTVTLTGNSFFAGNTRIDAGTLFLGTDASPNASLAGLVTVDGGTLRGLGGVGTLNNSSGTVAPGGSIGALRVGGNYTQGNNGTLRIEVSPTAASQLAVGGAANLAGTLSLVYDPGVYVTRNFGILSAGGGVNGQFGTVTGNTPNGISQSIAYSTNSVLLQLNGTGFVGNQPQIVVAPTNDTIYSATTSTLVLNGQRATGIILDRLGSRQAGIADGPIAAPGQPGVTPRFAANDNLAAIGQIAEALPDAIATEGGWFRGIGGFSSINGSSSAPGYTGSAGGFLAGFDRQIDTDLYLGVAAGYLHSDVGEHSTSSGGIDTGRLALYGGGWWGPNLLTGTAGYGHDYVTTARGITGIGTATQNHNANEFTLGGQWSVPFSIDGITGAATLTPKAGFQFLHLSEGAFAENGASGFALAATNHSTDSLQPYVALAVAEKFVTEDGSEITPEARLGYTCETLNVPRTLSVITSGGVAFPATGVRPSRDMLTAGIGVVMRAAPDTFLYANYDAILHTGNTTDQTVSAGLRIRF
jgi:fibronectin-binding autotransporter adhesin